MAPHPENASVEDKLEQAEVILAYEGNAVRRVAAVRALLNDVTIPVRRQRPIWSEIAGLLLALDDDTVTLEEIRELRRLVGRLRKAVRDHQAGIDPRHLRQPRAL